jgi:hypothetical protein
MTTIETVKETIGHCNYYMVGTFEARSRVQNQLDQAGITDWKAGYSHHVKAIPEGAVRVGQVQVHHGDGDFPLWVRPASDAVV